MTPLLVFAEDWGRHNSGCQRITQELLRRGWPITWVNTIGTRRPGFDSYTVRRGMIKLRQWCLSSRVPQSREHPAILSPVMWPSMHFATERLLNARLVAAQLRKQLASLGEPPVGISKIPLPSSLIDRLPARRWIYYCVDHISAWPGNDRLALEELESTFLERADAIIVASDELRERLAQRGHSSTVLTHGVDLDFWRHPPSLRRLPEYPRPLVVYWGLVDPRIDVAIVQRLSKDLKQGSILFVGPKQTPPAGLFDLPRVHRHGAVDLADLPAIGQAADVLIMPFLACDATRYMQPVKLKEYMASGKPVVVTPLPAIEPWRDSVSVAGDAEAFSAAVRQALETGLTPEHRAARSRLDAETWSSKADRFLSIALGTER